MFVLLRSAQCVMVKKEGFVQQACKVCSAASSKTFSLTAHTPPLTSVFVLDSVGRILCYLTHFSFPQKKKQTWNSHLTCEQKKAVVCIPSALLLDRERNVILSLVFPQSAVCMDTYQSLDSLSLRACVIKERQAALLTWNPAHTWRMGLAWHQGYIPVHHRPDWGIHTSLWPVLAFLVSRIGVFVPAEFTSQWNISLMALDGMKLMFRPL